MNKNKNLLKFVFIPVILALNACGDPKDLEYKYLFTANDEKLIGSNEHKILIKKLGNEISDGNLKKYVENIKNKILVNSGNRNLIIRTYIYESKTIKAFTTLGGYIYFSTAMLNVLTKDELYALMCHEIAHVISRDNSEMRSLSILYKNLKVNRSKSNSIIVSKSEHNNIFFKKYLMKKSRINEYQADKVALDLLSKSGYDRKFLILFLKKIENYSRVITGPAKAFSSHPNIKDRIARAEALINKSSIENASLGIKASTD